MYGIPVKRIFETPLMHRTNCNSTPNGSFNDVYEGDYYGHGIWPQKRNDHRKNVQVIQFSVLSIPFD